MFYIFIVLFLALVSYIFWIFTYMEKKKGVKYDVDEVSVFKVFHILFLVSTIIMFMIGLFENLGSYSAQVERFEDVRKHQCNIKIYDERYNFLKLQSSSTLTTYKMQVLADASYKEMIAAQGISSKIRYKYNSPWQIIKPSIPDDIYPLVFYCKN